MIFYITEIKTQPFYAKKHKIPICGDNDKKSVIIFAENVCIFKKDLYLCTAFKRKCFRSGSLGEVAEWSIAAVLKTVVPRGTRGSNPCLSADRSGQKQTINGQKPTSQ